MNMIRHIAGFSVAGAVYFASAAYSFAGEHAEAVSDHVATVEGAVATHAPEHAASSGLPQFDPTWFASQVFWLAVCFAFLYVVFAKKTLPNISSTIDRRRQQIESDIETTESLTNDSEAILEEYERNLKNSQAKARAIVVGMVQNLKADADIVQKKFRDKAEKTIAKTETVIEEAKQTALQEVQTIAADVAIATVDKLLGAKVDQKVAISVVKSLVSGKQKMPSPVQKKTTKKAA
ncbi:MAG: hypothetical protein JKY11_09105 [Alphaproteobacteria bacterium]|nr:hypothetical protein [Alphaproteobacteria bacterium]